MKIRILGTLIFSVLISISSFATHIVGGEITVKWVSGNNFEVTLNFYRDCGTGNGNTGFDASVNIGVFDKVTNVAVTYSVQPVLPLVDSVSILVGDNCYDPKLCVKKARYVRVITIPDNPHGYYISWHRCCRNGIITNIANPGSSGYVFYAEMPDPALHNSSPTFAVVPDGYMCQGYGNSDSYTATDPDGDNIVYSFSQPLDCAANGICGTANPLPGISPGPYGNITYGTNYSLAKPMGDPAQSINASTGIVSTTPPTQGVYVICVRAEEYRAGVKIGEIRRDYQYKVLPCSILTISPKAGFSICAGVSNTLSITGAHSGSTYVWSPGGQTTSSIVITPTSAGTYTYQVIATATTTLGTCIESAVAAITVNALPAPIVSASGSLCLGQNTTLSATATAGTAPFTYSWLPGGYTTSAISGSALSNGTYTATVTSSQGCSSKATGVINQAPVLTTTLSVTNIACSGNPAMAIVSQSGGTSAYTYLWNTVPIQTSATATGLVSGNYSVVVTDSKGCTSTKTVSITVTATPIVTVSTTVAACGVSDGTGTANPSGGSSPYTYLWKTTPVQTSQTATGMAGGTYSVTVTSADGCSRTMAVTVNNTNAPTISGIPFTPAGCTVANGTATANAANGTPAYSYSWNTSPVQSTQTATGLSGGYYQVTVTDVNGCSVGGTVSISITVPPTTSTSATKAGCSVANGTATATPSGGTGNYFYLWTPGGQTTKTAVNLSGGTYSVTVTDANGCSVDETVIVPITTAPITSVSSSNALCYEDSSGTATASIVSGGTPGFYYLWTPAAQTTKTATGLISGSYSVLITDANGCTSTQTVTVSQPSAAVTVTTSTAGFVCGTIANGSATANPIGGTGSFTYSWSTSPVQTTASISNLTIGTYSVLVTDANGCANNSGTATIYPSVVPAAYFSYVPIISCDGVGIKFTNLSSQASTALWDFGDHSAQSNELNPIHVFPTTGTYTVSLYVTNPPCNNTLLQAVKFNDISSFNFGAANVFSPNNDGINDCFHPSMTDVSGSSVDTLFPCISLQVFDRWGVVMFESTDYAKCWNGRNAKDNKDANDGVYYYIAKFGNSTIQGSITLARHGK